MRSLRITTERSKRCAAHQRAQRHAAHEAGSVVTPPTSEAARRAGVSRTFLYENADAKALMAAAITAVSSRSRQVQAGKDQQTEASWRERVLNAENALTAAHTEIRTQREKIGLLLGQIRDLESEYAKTPSSASPRRTPP